MKYNSKFCLDLENEAYFTIFKVFNLKLAFLENWN